MQGRLPHVTKDMHTPLGSRECARQHEVWMAETHVPQSLLRCLPHIKPDQAKRTCALLFADSAESTGFGWHNPARLTACKHCSSTIHQIRASVCFVCCLEDTCTRQRCSRGVRYLPGMTRIPLGAQPTRQDCPSIRPASATQPEASVKLIG